MKLVNLEYKGVVKHGGFATIQRFIDKDTNVKYAVKKLKEEYRYHLDYIDRFIKEIDYTERLKENPNIIDILDSSIDSAKDEYLYLMPLADMNLDEYIAQNNDTLDFEKRLNLFEQILDAICFAHQKKIWHRDLSPTNVLIFLENDNCNLKVCDFGLGKDPESLSRMAQSSIAGHGQALYVDPEQLISLKQGNHIGDIYSLSKILYYVLTGKKPTLIQKSEFYTVIKKGVNKEYQDVFEFKEEYFKFKNIYSSIRTEDNLSVKEYLEQSESIDWQEFYRYSLKGINYDHIYFDYIDPVISALKDKDTIETFFRTIGKDDESFIEVFLDKLDDCLNSTGWPFTSTDSFTSFLIRFAKVSSNNEVKLKCLEKSWYIAAVGDQWDSQDQIIKVFLNYTFPPVVEENLGVYILEIGKPFAKLSRVDLSKIKSLPIKRAIAQLRQML
ncbi:protein kinase domain-containing protein [Rossellomorea sp. NPDC071047]|uniref:protein kinase domain-containing protein n=1 Tax=Rossellomorea sp. NPDC071047 TaxID=3390675 RepID=UPI003CFC34B2